MNGTDYRIYPLGLDAVTVDFGSVISEQLNDRVLALAARINEAPFAGFIEAVPAFSSLTVFFDFVRTRGAIASETSVFEFVSEFLSESVDERTPAVSSAFRIIEIPVDFSAEAGPDLGMIADSKHLSTPDVVKIFTARIYRVFMLGFLPGFAYMGQVDERIAFARKASPRIRVEKGSVGIAGKQTGIYPSASPGGWQIIGRTDFELFRPDAEPMVALQAGDRVKFIAV